MFWGDIALNHPELISKLPKELVAMTWGYSPLPDFSKQILPFRDAGMDFFVCPGVNNWNRMFPNFDDAVGNINNFVRDGKKHGAMGMFNTDWRDDGEALLNMAWHPVVFSAAAAWQPGAVDVAKFDAAFDWAFYRNSGSEFVDSIHNLARINALLRSAKCSDASNGLFWFDPFSKHGAGLVRRLLPVAGEIRTLAETTAIQLQANSAKARLHPRTVDYLRFAALRADTTLMRAQLSSQIAKLYREAMDTPARTTSLLGAMSSPNGLVQDIRDAVVQRKAHFRRLWLDENRPYFLDSMLARYDHEILYWTAKERLFIQLRNEFNLTKSLPTPEQAGLVLP
jgi:hexosaminidase